MNAYTTEGLTQIRNRDVANILSTHSYLDGASLAALERQRGWQADAEAGWLLKQHGVLPPSVASRVALLRQTIGTALVRVGQHLAAAPGSGVAPASASARGTLGTAG